MIIGKVALMAIGLFCLWAALGGAEEMIGRRPHVTMRGIYGGVPTQWFERGETLAEYGVNAIFMGSGSLTAEGMGLLKKQGAKVFAEFNTMHDAGYLKEHPDAAPVGADGQVCPPPDGWQGVCPTHPGYRKYRMDAFRKVLTDFAVDGVWLDYHHSHASWEQAEPNMPDTCFCERCIARFAGETKCVLPQRPVPELAKSYLLGTEKARWVQWRCHLFTDWVRQFRAIIEETRSRRPPGSGSALLGTYHCPWNDTDFDGALRNKLAIDLKAQSKYLDVFSPMPYHARFGHAADPAWISRQTAWLGRHLGIEGKPGERHRIWPIVQLSDWGETVPAEQVPSVLDHGTRPPSTGVMVFAWGSLADKTDRVTEMGRFYRAIGDVSRE